MKFKVIKLVCMALFGATLYSVNAEAALGFNPAHHESSLPGFSPVIECMKQNIVDNENDVDYNEEQNEKEINYEIEINEDELIEDQYPEEAEEIENNAFYGSTLTKINGVVNGPSGKETFYNLDMSRIVSIMGTDYGSYWIREDGCKMLGEYVMVAADLKIRPRGTIVETSLGTGIVVDTGDFTYSNPYQLDIATTW